MKCTAMAGLLALVGWSAQATAYDVPGWRIGGAVSFGDFNWSSGDTNLISGSSVGVKLYTQYQVNDWFGIEGAYHDSGDFDSTLRASPDPNLPDGDYKLSFHGFSAAAVGYLPIPSDDIKIYGKVGLFDFNDYLTYNGSSSSSSSEDGLMAGGGAVVNISDHFGIRADLDWFDVDVGKLWMVNLGIEYYFGGAPKPVPVAAPVPVPVAEAPPPPPPPPPADSDGDGVPDDRDACPDTPAGAKVDARGCEEEIVLQGVTFENNSAKLTPNSTLTLDSVAAILKKRPNFKVEIRGHTDSSGPDEYNMKLSQRRADSVMEYLISQGVDAGKLTAMGYGETQPVASNDTAEGRAQNRRVALEFTENR